MGYLKSKSIVNGQHCIWASHLEACFGGVRGDGCIRQHLFKLFMMAHAAQKSSCFLGIQEAFFRQSHFAWDKHGVSLHMCIQRLGIFNTLSYLHYNSIQTQINDECSLSGAFVYCTLIHDIQCLSQESRSLQSQPSDWPCL